MHESSGPKPATTHTQHSGIKWKSWNKKGATAHVAGKIYLLIAFEHCTEVEVDWRYNKSDKWHFIHDKLILPDMKTAKQWCEMHHATGADK